MRNRITRGVRVLWKVGLALCLANLLLHAFRLAIRMHEVIPHLSNSDVSRAMLEVVWIVSVGVMLSIPLAWMICMALQSRFSKLVTAVAFGEVFVLVWFLIGPGKFDVLKFMRQAESCKGCDFQVGGIDLKGQHFTDESLVSLFGPGCKVGEFRRNYYFSKDKVTAEFTRSVVYDRLRLQKAEGESTECVAATRLNSLTTGRGLGFGDDVSKMIATYGLPTESATSSPGVTKFIYRSSEGDAMEFETVNGKVSGIGVWIAIPLTEFRAGRTGYPLPLK